MAIKILVLFLLMAVITIIGASVLKFFFDKN
jgi:Na+-transporting methylmalonyl-CoA/oxaloacetate decarboxylase gamma subunit